MIRILFAHQDPKLSGIYTQRMQNQFLVDSAADGLSAVRKFRVSPPALVVSDYDLPIISGMGLLRFIRNHKDFYMTPFIFLSNSLDNSEALSLAANDWLNLSSCHPDYLLDRIHHHLRSNKYGLQIHRA
jgi:DNA-binding response OmpR family regulator